MQGKAFLSLLKRKDLYFVIIIYPVLALAYVKIKSWNVYNSFAANKDNIFYYTLATFAVSVFTVTMYVFEYVEKRFMHKIQGSKLKLKQQLEERS
ncbi:MAG: hypothetical protein QXW71_00105 [Thermoplasmata archaeon]